MFGSRLIVFISGWARRDFLWFTLQANFRIKGYDVIIAHVPNNGFDDIYDAAVNIAVMLQEVRPFYDKIVLCGHSMGGLIGRVIIQELESKMIDAYISIGTPHRGSQLARIAPWSKSAKQMIPGSGLLKSLNSQPWPEDVPALAIQAGWEDIVWPRSSAKIWFGKNVTIPNATHVSVLLHGSTFVEIRDWLNKDVFHNEDKDSVFTGILSKMDT